MNKIILFICYKGKGLWSRVCDAFVLVVRPRVLTLLSVVIIVWSEQALDHCRTLYIYINIIRMLYIHTQDCSRKVFNSPPQVMYFLLSKIFNDICFVIDAFSFFILALINFVFYLFNHSTSSRLFHHKCSQVWFI